MSIPKVTVSKQVLLLSAAILVTAVLAGAAFAEYQNNKDNTNTAVATAQKQRASALKELAQHDAAAKLNTQANTSAIQVLQSQKASVCAQLLRAKLVNPVCTP